MADEPKKKRGRPKKQVAVETHIIESVKLDNASTKYKILGKPKVISAKQRQSISYRGNYYTFEYYEERELPISDDVNLAKEKESLWYSVNSEVDNQICDMLEFLQNKENN